MLLAQGQAYRQEYDFNAIHLIPANLYGPGDNFDEETSHVVPSLIRKFCNAALRDEPSVTLWGSGQATREFLYVEDAARAIVLATEGYDSAEPVNIGTGVETSIADLAALLAEGFSYRGEVIWDSSKSAGTARRRLDVSRAKVFGFQAETSLVEGLRQTLKWFVSA
jgi:GDP-L-fucose synthase